MSRVPKYKGPLTSTEKKFWNELTGLFNQLLDDLNLKGLLRRGTPHEDRVRLSHIWRNSGQFAQTYNKFLSLFSSEEHFKSILKQCEPVGLTVEMLTQLYLAELVVLMLLDLELFKTSLLFFLEEKNNIRKNITLGQLLETISSLSPAGAKIRQKIDTRLRNSIAHGLFWFERGGKVYVADNGYLENIRQISLTELLIISKKHNILVHSFISVLREKINQGYFKA